MMNQKMADYATILKENNKRGKKIKFSLPIEQEWVIVLEKGLNKLNNSVGFSCVLDLT